MKTHEPSAPAAILADLCCLIENREIRDARRLLASRYPFDPNEGKRRSFSMLQSTRIFLRDGFLDRYSGERLVFPGALRILSLILPKDFPFHPHWKMAETHIAYWQLSPTLDHVVPLARGGTDDEANIVTTSMLRNGAKSNWTLDELGWSVHPSGFLSEWDGLIGWFVKQAERDPELMRLRIIKDWRAAARAALEEIGREP